MQRPINKIPITLVGRARRRLVKTISPIERLEASGMSPERALIRSESDTENSTGILKLDRRKDWSLTRKNVVIPSLNMTFVCNCHKTALH